jgi:hypothetical protein
VIGYILGMVNAQSSVVEVAEREYSVTYDDEHHINLELYVPHDVPEYVSYISAFYEEPNTQNVPIAIVLDALQHPHKYE